MTDKIEDQPDGATPLDDVSGLLFPDITSRQELDAIETINILEAVEWYRSGRVVNDAFTVPFYYELHRRMLHRVWSWAGQPRTTDATNIGVPGAYIVPELGRLAMEANRRWSTKGESALFYAWYHHQAVWIHPFLNGNGRWARLLCDVVRVRKANASALNWSIAGVADAGDERKVYIAALKEADAGNIQPLTNYVAERNPDI